MELIEFDTIIWRLRTACHLSKHHYEEFAAGIYSRLRFRLNAVPIVNIISWIAKWYMQTITYDLVFIGKARGSTPHKAEKTHLSDWMWRIHIANICAFSMGPRVRVLYQVQRFPYHLEGSRRRTGERGIQGLHLQLSQVALNFRKSSGSRLVKRCAQRVALLLISINRMHDRAAAINNRACASIRSCYSSKQCITVNVYAWHTSSNIIGNHPREDFVTLFCTRNTEVHLCNELIGFMRLVREWSLKQGWTLPIHVKLPPILMEE